HREAVNTGRRFAMGKATAQELEDANSALIDGMGQSGEFDYHIWQIAEGCILRDAAQGTRNAAHSLGSLLEIVIKECVRLEADKRRDPEKARYKALYKEAAARMAKPIQAKILRCLLGVPFRKVT